MTIPPGREGARVDDAGPRDGDGVLAVARALPAWFSPRGLAHMAVDLRFQRALVVRDGTRVVGFLSYFVHERVAWIGWMGVLPDRQRRGLGRALVERLVSILLDAGVAEVRVETLGDAVDYAPYAATRAFYRALGFRDLARVAQNDPEMPERLTLSRALAPTVPGAGP